MSENYNPELQAEYTAKLQEKGYKPLFLTYDIIDISSKVNQLKRMIAKLQKHNYSSKDEIIQRAFIAGLYILEAEMDIENIERDDFIIESPRMAKLRKLEEIRAKRSEFRTDEEILQDFGGDLDKYIEWCKETGNEYEKFVEYKQQHSFSIPLKVKDASYFRHWLVDYLADRKERHVNEIKEAMLATGAIDSDEHWNHVSKIASEEGISGNGRRGYWKLP